MWKYEVSICMEDKDIVDAIIKRLEELEELRDVMKDYVHSSPVSFAIVHHWMKEFYKIIRKY
jgi:hypothetical protein